MYSICDPYNQLQARRQFLKTSGMGLGVTALASLLPQNAAAAHSASTLTPKAKQVIFLFMAGAPSQVDLFDYKPDLGKLFKQPLPESVSMGQRVTAMTRGQTQLVAPSMFGFKRSGESGIWVSELLPHLSEVADDLCIVNSLYTNAINHDPAKTFICTGSEIPGKASMGAWLSYGLGSMNRDLPDFIVLTSAFWTGGTRNVQALYSRLWGSGFLPSKHQGAAFQTSGDPVLFLSNPAGVDRSVRRRMLDALGQVNSEHFQEIGDPEIQTTVAQQEMAFRMQASVPELTDISGEPQHILDMYGPEIHKNGSFSRNCLLARRMVERGVRFTQVFHRGWDHHNILPQQLRGQCYDVDQPCAALLTDLKQRGLLDDTIIVFAGEFGRTVYCQGKLERDDYGRDHHPRCFSGWLAGGGIRGGLMYGQTDDFSYNVVENPVAIRDLHATILHQLGIDHRKLTFPFQGLDQRLTGVEPSRIIREILT
ncbi:MAG: DUF1501 domain-containing protein [Planctomycetaceae bacterium]